MWSDGVHTAAVAAAAAATVITTTGAAAAPDRLVVPADQEGLVRARCLRACKGGGRRATLPLNVNIGGRGQMIVFLSLCE